MIFYSLLSSHSLASSLGTAITALSSSRANNDVPVNQVLKVALETSEV